MYRLYRPQESCCPVGNMPATVVDDVDPTGLPTRSARQARLGGRV